MAAEHAIALAGQTLLLLGERAVHWPDQRALLIADLHLGKADVLRRAGIAAPRGSTGADLDRLQALIERHRPDTLWVLGDLLHGPLHEAPWLARWRRFRAAHAALRIRVVVGNHDRAVDAGRLAIEREADAQVVAGLRLCHAPSAPGSMPYLCGHLHPCVRLPGVPRRWPAFSLRAQGLVLPAFSLLTGSSPPTATKSGAHFACVEGQVIPIGRRSHDALRRAGPQ